MLNNVEVPQTGKKSANQTVYGEWSTVQRNRRRGPTTARGKTDILPGGKKAISKGGDIAGDNETVGVILQQNPLWKDNINDPTFKAKSQPLPMANREFAANKQGLTSGLNGSRFASLYVEDTEEDMLVEDLNEDGIAEESNEETVNAPIEPGSKARKDAEKQREEQDVVVVSSNPKIVEGLKKMKLTGQVLGPSPPSVKDRLAKE